MPRARNIKPGFFENEVLAELPIAARLLFIGLWTLADREGRLEDRPKKIRLQLMPLDDVDVDALLDELERGEMILRYEAEECRYIQVLNFCKHQTPHCKEKASTIPAPGKHSASTVQAEKEPVPAPPDSLNPDSLNPEENNRSSAAAPDRFPDFWQAYPKKVKKQETRKVWKSRKLDAKADDLIADVQNRQAKDGRWLEGFVPDPTTYLRGSRWEDELEKPRINGSAKPAWAQVPRDDDKLWPWAKEHGYPNPGTMNYYQYRQALQAAVEKRMGGR